jgi:hypothetical protein
MNYDDGDAIIAIAGIGREAKQATSTIPIVIATDPDPVGNGPVESWAHQTLKRGISTVRAYLRSGRGGYPVFGTLPRSSWPYVIMRTASRMR